MKLSALVFTFVICLFSATSISAQQNIAVVDLQKVFDGYYKTKEADKELKAQGQELDRTLKEMLENHKAKLAEVESSRQNATNPALSQVERERLAKESDSKLNDLRVLEGNIQKFDQTSKSRLAQMQLDYRQKIIKELSEVIKTIALQKGFDMVIDSAAKSKNDTPIVLFSNGKTDITDETIKEANKSQNASLAPTGLSPLGQ